MTEILFLLVGIIIGLRINTSLSMEDRINLAQWENEREWRWLILIYLILWLLSGYMISILICITINNQVFGYKFLDLSDVLFSLIFMFFGLLNLLYLIQIYIINKYSLSIDLDRKIWTRKKGDDWYCKLLLDFIFLLRFCIWIVLCKNTLLG